MNVSSVIVKFLLLVSVLQLNVQYTVVITAATTTTTTTIATTITTTTTC